MDYEVVRGSIKVPYVAEPGEKSRRMNTSPRYLRPGEMLPEGMFTEEDIESLEKSGIIKASAQSKSSPRPRRLQRRGKWSVNPDTLAGKDQEALLLMVLEIDPEFDTDKLKTKEQTIAQLTKDFDMEFDVPVATATDKTRPGFRGTEHAPENGVKDLGDTPMTPKAREALERSRARNKTTG